MKYLLVIFVFISTICFADELQVAVKIMDKISYALIKKSDITVLAIGKEEKEIVKNSSLMREVGYCSDSDMVLAKSLDEFPDICKNKILFLTSYKTFKKNKTAIGAFFWQKGRPNIIFRKNILKFYNISLSREFDKFVE